MTPLLRAELFKLRTTRSAWLLALAALALSAAGVTLTLALSSISSESDARSLLSFAGASGLVVLILAVVDSAGEWRHRTILPTLLATPDRRRALAAKTLAHTLVGTAIGLGCVALTAAIALPWLGGNEAVPASDVMLRGFAGSVAYCALSAALGAGLGMVTRNQVGAVAGLAVFISVIDPAVSALVPDAGKYGPSALGIALSGGVADTQGPFGALLSVGTAALVYLAYATVLVLAAAATLARRDVRA